MLNEHDIKDFDSTEPKPIILKNAIRTPDGTILVSKHRHDYQSHYDAVSKEMYFVDGGNEYLRRSSNKVPAEDLAVTTADPFIRQREAFEWSSWTRDAAGKLQKVNRKLMDLTDDHITAILKTQAHIYGTFVQTLMEQEMKFRKAVKELNGGFYKVSKE